MILSRMFDYLPGSSGLFAEETIHTRSFISFLLNLTFRLHPVTWAPRSWDAIRHVMLVYKQVAIPPKCHYVYLLYYLKDLYKCLSFHLHAHISLLHAIHVKLPTLCSPCTPREVIYKYCITNISHSHFHILSNTLWQEDQKMKTIWDERRVMLYHLG